MTAVVHNHQAATNRNRDSRHEATVTTRYIRDDEATFGWVKVGLANGGFESLCEFTKVTLIKHEGGKTYFRIADGWRSVGQVAWLSEAHADHLSDKAPTVAATTLHVRYGIKSEEVSPFKGPLMQQWGTLDVAGQHVAVTLNSVWNGAFSPIPPGTHKIMVPDASHAKISTLGYRDSLPGRIKGNDCWFPIELSGTPGNSSRYVHIGHLSDGCVTVHELAKWNAVYDYLISHRLPGTQGRYCALLEVSR